MSDFSRRQFLHTSVLGAVSLGIAASSSSCTTLQAENEGVIVDTNVDILGWPFRNLKYGAIPDLVAKLRKHRVKEAWTGSYEALFHKNIDAVNAKLASACEEQGDGLLTPFGAVNPAWPDWQEDLRRVDELYGMPGIKLYPSYQNFSLGDPEVAQLIEQATDRGLIVVIAVDMEDERVHHPRIHVTAADVRPLAEVLPKIPDARVVLANAFRHVRGNRLQLLIDETDVLFDIARLDGAGGLQEVLGDGLYRGAELSLDRLVFGSHAPFFPIENVLFKFMESPVTEAQAAAIMHENVEQVLAA
jgi:predicted TIM-barrel fold metal-dependent hydrolase